MTNKHLKLQKLSVVLSVLSVAVAQKAPASSRTPPPPPTHTHFITSTVVLGHPSLMIALAEDHTETAVCVTWSDHPPPPQNTQ